MNNQSFFADIRAFLIPEKRWHYIFHFLVVLVAVAYWVGSLLKLPDASWAEIIMYRPRGDNQVYPAITALSHLNLGDPTDMVTYGQGICGSQAIILLPYALAYAVIGGAGYMFADALLCWVYLLVITLFLRRCNLGNFWSLCVGSVLAIGGLQSLSSKVGQCLGKLLSLFNIVMTDWSFPDLFVLQIFMKRIPRPIVTEIFVVLLLYFLVRQWQERRIPSLKRGLAMGGLMALILQGDPYMLAALGLLFLVVMGVTLAQNHWRIPWRFTAGLVLGTICTGWYFIFQRIFEHPDAPVRFGLLKFSRSTILALPGYAPLLRVGVVCLLAGLVLLTIRRARQLLVIPVNLPAKKNNGKKHQEQLSEKTVVQPDHGFSALSDNQSSVAIESAIAIFFVGLMIAGYLAQPIQLLLLGQGAQIYHYLISTLPTLYSYAVLILGLYFVKYAISPEARQQLANFGQQPHWQGGLILALGISILLLLGCEDAIDAVKSKKNSRQELVTPWAKLEDKYRPNFRSLDKAFREHPELRQARSMVTLCYEVHFLLTAFHGKRAFLPDNGYTTLGDRELENRLCETGRLLEMQPDRFCMFIREHFIMNYWGGCAKYWFSSEYKFSPDYDYPPEAIQYLKQMHKQAPFVLVMPNSEVVRLSERYISTITTPPDKTIYPDVIILTVAEREKGYVPNSKWYKEVFNNEAFLVYLKTIKTSS